MQEMPLSPISPVSSESPVQTVSGNTERRGIRKQLQRIDESEPGVVFNFCFFWPRKGCSRQPLSPSSSERSSEHSLEQSLEQGSEKNMKQSEERMSEQNMPHRFGRKTGPIGSVRANEYVSCNISSFPVLLGQIINDERQRRSSYDIFAINQEAKKTSGAIILASKRLQCIVKDNESEKRCMRYQFVFCICLSFSFIFLYNN